MSVYIPLGIVASANLILSEWIIFNGLETKPRFYNGIKQIEMKLCNVCMHITG